MITNKDVLATEIFSELMKSYPLTAPDSFYASDSSYISGLLLKHLRNTPISNGTLERNSSFFMSFVKTVKYGNRGKWLKGISEAIGCFFPLTL